MGIDINFITSVNRILSSFYAVHFGYIMCMHLLFLYHNNIWKISMAKMYGKGHQ
jgi:hypothetical protein